MKHVVISFVNPDRPGIVENISSIVKRHSGNWQTSSLHHLSGLFAGIIELTVDEAHVKELTEALRSEPSLNLDVVIAPSEAEESEKQFVLELTANDRSGIVKDISTVIHQHNGNLVKLVSSQDNAPHTGQLMFKAKAHIAVNQNAIDGLIAALENLADDLMVDISY